MTRIKTYIFLSLAALLFLLPTIVFAGQKKVIFNYDILTSPIYTGLWQISNNSDSGLYKKDDGMLLKSDGDAYLIYPFQFSYHDYDKINIIFYSDQPVRVLVIPNVSTTGFNNFELRKKLPATNETYQTTSFSLHVPFFKDIISDLGINFYSTNPAQIVIKEISLEKLTPPELALQTIKDYWRVAPYSPFTVNVFPTPRVLGRSATVYFLPIILILIYLILFNKKWRKIAGLILLLLWFLTDMRMSYEAVAHNINDYKNFIKPPLAEKNLRTYDDFYQFADWVKENLNREEEIKFYNFGSAHFPRLLQYLIYPVRVYSEKQTAVTYVVFNRREISYNETDQKLYKSGKPISQAGDIVASYNQYSFIFKEQLQ